MPYSVLQRWKEKLITDSVSYRGYQVRKGWGEKCDARSGTTFIDCRSRPSRNYSPPASIPSSTPRSKSWCSCRTTTEDSDRNVTLRSTSSVILTALGYESIVDSSGVTMMSETNTVLVLTLFYHNRVICTLNCLQITTAKTPRFINSRALAGSILPCNAVLAMLR